MKGNNDRTFLKCETKIKGWKERALLFPFRYNSCLFYTIYKSEKYIRVFTQTQSKRKKCTEGTISLEKLNKNMKIRILNDVLSRTEH